MAPAPPGPHPARRLHEARQLPLALPGRPGGAPSGPEQAVGPSSSLLDLSAPEPAARTGGTPPRRKRPRTLPYPRIGLGARTTLTPESPTVTLTRLQAGLGQLECSLVRGASTGDLSLGMIYEDEDRATHVVQRLGDALASPEQPMPVIRLADQGDDVLIDLHLLRSFRRALLYGYSPSGALLNWDGVLTLNTQGASTIEAAVNLGNRRGSAALVTVYNVHGELVIRSEMKLFEGPQELAAQAFGYSYAWLDGRLPTSR